MTVVITLLKSATIHIAIFLTTPKMFDKIQCNVRKRKENNNTNKYLRFVGNLDDQSRKIFSKYLKGGIIVNHNFYFLILSIWKIIKGGC